jgi:hypothetical protein
VIWKTRERTWIGEHLPVKMNGRTFSKGNYLDNNICRPNDAPVYVHNQVSPLEAGQDSFDEEHDHCLLKPDATSENKDSAPNREQDQCGYILGVIEYSVHESQLAAHCALIYLFLAEFAGAKCSAHIVRSPDEHDVDSPIPHQKTEHGYHSQVVADIEGLTANLSQSEPQYHDGHRNPGEDPHDYEGLQRILRQGRHVDNEGREADRVEVRKEEGSRAQPISSAGIDLMCRKTYTCTYTYTYIHIYICIYS